MRQKEKIALRMKESGLDESFKKWDQILLVREQQNKSQPSSEFKKGTREE